MTLSKQWWFFLLPCFALVISQGERSPVEAADSAKDSVDFAKQIRPILAKNCYACHGPDKQESGIALHEAAAATSAGDSGDKPIVPGDVMSSELVRRVTSTDPAIRMPPDGEPLSEKQVELLKRWIGAGAEYREHWAFLPLSHPLPPETKVDQGTKKFAEDNPIDAFIQEKLIKNNLVPAVPANPRSLVRRLYFDCLGVPPDLEAVERFAANPSELAYIELVDGLLADPRFGERMARDWLDVVRYAETNSYERDGVKPNAWKYRDYVIRSMNIDKPYDRFLREQLAGDELEPPTAESLTATGFFRLGIWDDEPADPLKAMYDEFDDMVTTVGQGMLGLTLNCARCHDHKIDPIPQKDYYQMVAFLRDVQVYGTRGDHRSNNQIDVSDESLRQKNNELKDSIKQMREQLHQVEETGIAKMNAEDKQAAKSPDREKVLREKLKEQIGDSQWEEYQALKKKIDETRKEIESLPLDFRLGVAKSTSTPAQTFVLTRGLPQAEGEPVEPSFPKLFKDDKPEGFRTRTNSSGRRTQLVDWMTSPTNRLTGRVIANRLWQHHFGRGIVRSANNFGQLGDPPTHPELLDFLAEQLVRYDWQLKPLQRMMLLSKTYRLSSNGNTQSIEQDPTNDYFSRYNVRRLSAEELRDAVLTVNQKINWQQSGPSFYPDVSNDVKAGQSVPGSGWGNSTNADKARRSVYIHIKRSLIPPELSVFDFPETDTSCEGRFLTTQAAQALNMLNGAFLQEQSKLLATLAAKRANTLRERVQFAIESAYSRPAEPAELTRALDRIDSLQKKFALDESRAFNEYCLVLLNSNEFMYLD